MRTHSSWSRSARIWESRRRSWTFVCLIFRPSFKKLSCKRRSCDHGKPPPAQKIQRSNQKKNDRLTILGRINDLRLPNERYQRLEPPALVERSQSVVASPMMSSTAVAATWTSLFDAISTSPTMSSSSATPSSSDLASLIYSTFIVDHLKSNSNLELNLYKNLFRKFFYPQLTSFLDNALSAQPH